MKVYRDWRILGEEFRITAMYPMVKQSMDYCIRTWDPDEKRHLAGTPSEKKKKKERKRKKHLKLRKKKLNSGARTAYMPPFILGALAAITAMGKHLGEDVSQYERLSQTARAFTEIELYDGEILHSTNQILAPVKTSEKLAQVIG